MTKKFMRKNEIIKASIHLMYLKGYNGTSVKDITDAAGIPKGSFYNYFVDKERYAIDAIRYYYAVNSKGFFRILIDQELEPLERIKTFFKKGIEMAEQQDSCEGCFLGNIIQEMGNTNQLISEAAGEVQIKVVAMIYNNLVEAQANNQLKIKQNLKILASFIITSWQGTLLIMKIGNNKKVLADFYTVLTENVIRTC